MANVTRPENESSSVVVSPEFGIEGSVDDLLPLGLFSLRSEKCMCFSHHLLNANTGLLCGERGLFQFDLRLSPREQSTRSLLGNDKVCKSCAIWSAPSSTDIVDSAYVFAGGASSEVALYDLRMTDGSESRIVQKYRPSGLSRDSEVSVSGLDVSKDKRELLVSYENDQVFSFPVFPNSPGGRPTIDEMEEYSDSYSTDGDGPVLSELAAYGGHLNRFTFLKNAKYAGPQDEYICTGSDSGRAWIYERATGTVAAFLAADQSTCNGVMPHPSLPFFITYGIDSTAKLWRATPPVDRDADDSPLGRAREYHRQQYEKSTLVRNWTYAKATAGSIATLDDDESEAVTIYPDQFPISESPTIGNSILGSILMRRRMFGMRATRMSGICNDFRELPNILQKNLFSCVIASEEGESEPVSSGLADLVRRMSTIRLRFQADQRGLVWNPNDPWVLAPQDFYKGMELAEPSARKTVDVSKRESIVYGNPYDLIPGSPSDWLPYDPEMTKTPLPCGPRFNVEDYDDFYHERYSQLGFVIEETKMHGTRSRESAKQTDKVFESNAAAVNKQEPTPSIYDSERALQLLYDTALMLKEGGNAALESGSTMEAARRYDCAIRYCSVAILAHPNANTDLIQATERKWCPLRKLLVSTRLNLCMVLANFDLRGARDQATLALKELAPFCTQPGKVLGGKKLSTVFKEDEPMSTYQEAKELQAKAYFRHGSVDLKVGDYDEAVDEFEESIKCTKELSKEPDRVLLRRLAEAKREKIRKSKRQKRKFKRMLAKEGLKEEEEDSSQG
jgi:tetratricopeptide (TPR) repeat protein